jgi:putative isomerase
MILYQPEYHRLYTPAGRRWLFPRPDGGLESWTIFEWDSFFNALEVSIESETLASEIVRAVLDTQYPNGNIPNWRAGLGGTTDRSQPPVGSYVVLKLFEKLGNQELLRTAYPVLKKWHGFWKAKQPGGRVRRDGNGDGLLEWGSDKDLLGDKVPAWEENASGAQRAKWESGQDDLPNWDNVPFDEETGTLTMNCLDLNCLYALDSWCLAQMANILNLRPDHESYLAEYEKMKSLINHTLWNEREHFYFDRYWDGRFSTHKAASNFYPLLARIPDDKRALQMLRHLLNPKEFWGDYVLPSISRDDPAYKDQQYWRGTIWPPTNYLVYQGLKAYGFDTVASEFARKSASLFLRSWQNFQLCPENFDSRTGEAGGQRYQSWGPLFALIGVEEYLDFTPWEGFRFGLMKPETKGYLARLAVQGRHYDLSVSPSEILLKEEGKEILSLDGGAVVRHFLYSESEVSFDISSLEEREVEVRFLKKGKYQFLLDSQVKKIFRGQSFSTVIPEGKHNVLILLLDVDQ